MDISENIKTQHPDSINIAELYMRGNGISGGKVGRQDEEGRYFLNPDATFGQAYLAEGGG